MKKKYDKALKTKKNNQTKRELFWHRKNNVFTFCTNVGQYKFSPKAPALDGPLWTTSLANFSFHRFEFYLQPVVDLFSFDFFSFTLFALFLHGN